MDLSSPMPSHIMKDLSCLISLPEAASKVASMSGRASISCCDPIAMAVSSAWPI